MPLRIVIADDDPIVRLVVGTVIEHAPELELVGEAEDADGAIARAREERPDVVLLDLDMPGGGGARAAGEIRRSLPGVHVIVLSAADDEQARRDGGQAGAEAHLAKSAPPEEIVRTIARVGRP